MISSMRLALGAIVFVSLALLPTAPAPGASTTVAGKVLLVKGATPRADASNAVVWIVGPRGGSGGPVKMTQESKRFTPRVLVVPRQATVEFPNADPIYHNVFSVSGENRFDLGLYRSGSMKSRRFEQPGLVRVYCNIHPQMVGFLMVIDSEFAAVTGRDGAFRFEGVPAGSWTVKAWHEEGGEVAIPLKVPAGSDAPVTLSIDTSAYRPGPHKNKYGKDYPPQTGSDDERY